MLSRLSGIESELGAQPAANALKGDPSPRVSAAAAGGENAVAAELLKADAALDDQQYLDSLLEDFLNKGVDLSAPPS